MAKYGYVRTSIRAYKINSLILSSRSCGCAAIFGLDGVSPKTMLAGGAKSHLFLNPLNALHQFLNKKCELRTTHSKLGSGDANGGNGFIAGILNSYRNASDPFFSLLIIHCVSAVFGPQNFLHESSTSGDCLFGEAYKA